MGLGSNFNLKFDCNFIDANDIQAILNGGWIPSELERNTFDKEGAMTWITARGAHPMAEKDLKRRAL